MNKVRVTPSFYSLQTLANEWGCDVEQLELMESLSELEIITVQGDSREFRAVTREEKRRVEAMKPMPERASRYNPTERASHLALLGALLVLWARDANLLSKPYAVVSEIEQDAARWSIPMHRSKDTNAAMVGEAIAMLRSDGWANDDIRTSEKAA